jgi:hypothetical protein
MLCCSGYLLYSGLVALQCLRTTFRGFSPSQSGRLQNSIIPGVEDQEKRAEWACGSWKHPSVASRVPAILLTWLGLAQDPPGRHLRWATERVDLIEFDKIKSYYACESPVRFGLFARRQVHFSSLRNAGGDRRGRQSSPFICGKR